MSEHDMTSVKDFTLSRAGYGSVKWLGPTDLRAMPVSEIVEIVDNAVRSLK